MERIDTGKPADTKTESRFWDTLLDWLESFMFAIFVVLLVFIFLFRQVVVDGTSMRKTLSDKDRLVITNLFYTPETGDIVVFNCEGLNKVLIKRVIATEGQKLEIDYQNNTVSVDGKVLSEDYISEAMVNQPYFDSNYYHEDTQTYEYTIPKGKIFVMGDNRNHSEDSRTAMVGFISTSDIIGKVILRVSPFTKF